MLAIHLFHQKDIFLMHQSKSGLGRRQDVGSKERVRARAAAKNFVAAASVDQSIKKYYLDDKRE